MATLAPAPTWPLRARDNLAAMAADREALGLTIACAAALFWLVHRLPLVDLPQHAAQVAQWHDLLLGISPWADELWINLLTPYLIGYGLALPLSFVVPAGTAIMIVLTAAYLAFVVSSIQLRRDFGADARLDWLLVTPFLGFAFSWGFFTFLVATPVGLQFIRLAKRHSDGPTVRLGAGIVGLGVALLFCHGLVFLFAGLVGGVLVLARVRGIAGLSRALAPYALLGLALIAYAVASRDVAYPADAARIEMFNGLIERLVLLPVYLQGSFETDSVFVPFTLAMLAAPVLLGLDVRWSAAVPFAVAAAVFLAAPHFAFGTDLVYERMAVFLVPLYVLMFGTGAGNAPSAEGRSRVAVAAMVLACWADLGLHAIRFVGAAGEQADFETVLAAAEPQRRAFAVIVDRDDKATGAPLPFLYYTSWYQAEKGGMAVCSFASAHPAVVRFHPGRVPPGNDCFLTFEWHAFEGRKYDYFFVRQDAPGAPAELTANPDCAVRLVRAAGAWKLYERGICKGG